MVDIDIGIAVQAETCKSFLSSGRTGGIVGSRLRAATAAVVET